MLSDVSMPAEAYFIYKIPEDIHITFDPQFLLEVTFPQSGGGLVPVTAGVQLARNRAFSGHLYAVDA